MLVEQSAQWMWRTIGGTRFDVANTLLVFIGALAVVKLAQYLRYLFTLPPGPWTIPFLSPTSFMKCDFHMHFRGLAKKYGTIACTRLGTQLVVIISDYRIIRDTFRREEFTGRPKTEFINILGGYGVINAEGEMWKDQRKFLHDKLRNLGMTYMGSGKKIMQSRIMREVESLMHGLSLRRGAPTDVSTSLGMSISNVICSIIMGVRFRHGDKRFKRFMSLIEEGFKLFGSMLTVNYVPVLRHMPYLYNVRDKISRNRAEMAEFFQETIENHRTTFDRNNVRDLVDAYLLEIEMAKDQGNQSMLFQGKNHDRQMQQILGDLFSAGMETVKTTIEWALILMMHNPDAAKAVQEELDQVIGRSRMPSLEDMPFLPLTEATILEILRRSSIVPLGTTHAATEDVTLNGYTIPAGCQVVPLLTAVHMNPELWDKPEQFRPSRFLTAEGKVSKPEYFMPFGVGRRMCLGDVLARMELFLYFSSFLHKFEVKLPEGDKLPSLRGNPGITITPDRFRVCLIEREFDVADCKTNDAGNPLRNVGSH